MVKTYREKLNDLLLDGELDELRNALLPYTSTNVFELLAVNEKETRHSRVLAWLLNPLGDHGLYDEVLRRLIRWVWSKTIGTDTQFNPDCSFEIHREYQTTDGQSIDLLLKSTDPNNKIVIGIENKYNATDNPRKKDKNNNSIPGTGQLDEYHRQISTHYKDYTCIFVFLTLKEDNTPKHCDNPQFWSHLTYKDIIQWIESAMDSRNINSSIKSVLKQYVTSIRRSLEEYPSHITKLQREIYNRHKEAIDIINNANTMKEFGESERNLCEWIYQNHKDVIDLINRKEDLKRISIDYRWCLNFIEKSTYKMNQGNEKIFGKSKISISSKFDTQYGVIESYYELHILDEIVYLYFWNFNKEEKRDKDISENILNKLKEINPNFCQERWKNARPSYYMAWRVADYENFQKMLEDILKFEKDMIEELLPLLT